jgi:Glycosyltransferase family 87
MHDQREQVCRNIFYILLAQLVILTIWSLPAQAGPVFIQHAFGLDYNDFHLAAADWITHLNPYLRARFVTPPPSIFAGLLLLWLPAGFAAFLFFVLNLVLIVYSVRACANRLGLSSVSIHYLSWITLLFYPVYLLIERGNIDGLVLGCLSLAICTRSKTLRAALVALAIGLKLYPALLLVAALRLRQWKFVLGVLIALFLLFLPFLSLIVPFIHSVTARGEFLKSIDNISPASIFVAVAGLHIGEWLYLIFWTVTLALMAYRHTTFAADSGLLPLIPFFPWMVSFPLQVYPYSGVLLLPVLTWKLSGIQSRKPSLSDNLLINGFLLVGVQATAFTFYLQRVSANDASHAIAHPFFHLLNSLGMCLILISLVIAKPGPAHPRSSSDPAANSLSEAA